MTVRQPRQNWTAVVFDDRDKDTDEPASSVGDNFATENEALTAAVRFARTHPTDPIYRVGAVNPDADLLIMEDTCDIITTGIRRCGNHVGYGVRVMHIRTCDDCATGGDDAPTGMEDDL